MLHSRMSQSILDPPDSSIQGISDVIKKQRSMFHCSTLVLWISQDSLDNVKQIFSRHLMKRNAQPKTFQFGLFGISRLIRKDRYNYLKITKINLIPFFGSRVQIFIQILLKKSSPLASYSKVTLDSSTVHREIQTALVWGGQGCLVEEATWTGEHCLACPPSLQSPISR